MTYEEAHSTATLAILRGWAEWADDEVKALEATGLSYAEAAATFNSRCDPQEIKAVIRRNTETLARVLIEPRAPRTLQ